MALSYEQKRAKDASMVRQMATKLKQDIDTLEGIRNKRAPKGFGEFCKIRAFHNDIQGLIFVIQDKAPPVIDLLPARISDWIIQARLKAVTMFVEISREFVRDPPLTLTGSLTARDILSLECKNFSEARAFFNNVLMEQALDDKTADRLVSTLDTIEETITIIEELLSKSVNYLDEFD
jgi:hypothetical protein